MTARKTYYIRVSFFIITLIVINVNFIFAQQLTDSILLEQSKLNTINYYKKTVKENALIYAGNEYIENVSLEYRNQIIVGTPFFLADSLVNGTVNYEGVDYQLPIKFHEIEQKVLLNHPVNNATIELLNERINHFSIGQHFFYKTPVELLNIIKTNRLYAERLLDGRIQLWVIHEKLLKPTKRAEEQTVVYTSYDEYAVSKNGKWYRMQTEQDVLNFCADKKTEIKEYLNRQGLKFSKNFELSLIQALIYYQTIVY